MVSFDLQPHLIEKLLQLRPLAPPDFEPLFTVASDPLIWEQHPERTRYKREVFEGFFRAALESGGALVAIDSKTNEIIGSSRFTNFDASNSKIEIGYTFLARRCWGNGYNAEMKKLMLTHAFRFVDEVYFFIGENNLRSRKAIEKIGASLIDQFERQPKEGAKYFAVLYHLRKATAEKFLVPPANNRA